MEFASSNQQLSCTYDIGRQMKELRLRKGGNYERQKEAAGTD